MPTIAPASRAQDETATIAAFVAGASFETTQPSISDLEVLKARWRAGAPVYVSAVASRPTLEQIETAVRLRQRGFAPVPHLAARNFATVSDLDRWLDRMTEDAQVDRVLVIGGDRETPAGPFHHAVEAIDSGLLHARGIKGVDIAGYPDGHARISAIELEQALADKIEAAEQTGLEVRIVTQFAFAATSIVAWIRKLRDNGIEVPVRIGLAGPASLASLARFARICGVRCSIQGLARNTGLMKSVFGTAAPDELLRALARETASGRLGEISPHFYSFGGLGATARWAAAVAEGRISLDHDAGFSVSPPP